MDENKKNKNTLNDGILKILEANRRWLARGFVIPFRTTFIFGASQSELSIKSYDRLKFFHPKFLKP